MSKEIQVQIGLQCKNGEFTLPRMGGGHSIDQTVVGGGLPGYLLVGTSEEDITLTDLTKPGYMYIKNCGVLGSVTNDCILTYGPKSGTMVAFGELKIGEEACLRLADGVTLRMKSTDIETQVQLIILED